jgi:hypothetical protein
MNLRSSISPAAPVRRRRASYELDPATGKPVMAQAEPPRQPSRIILPGSPMPSPFSAAPQAAAMPLTQLVPMLQAQGCQAQMSYGVLAEGGPGIGINASIGPITIPLVFDVATAKTIHAKLGEHILEAEAQALVPGPCEDLLAEARANVDAALASTVIDTEDVR